MDLKATVFYTGGEVKYTFPFPYIREHYIKVRYKKSDGSYEDLTYLKDYEVEDKTVILTTAGDTTDVINIYRQTSTEPIVSFVDATILKADDLNLYQTQLLHLSEELSDSLLLNGGITTNSSTEQWDANNLRITNVANPIDDNDVVTYKALKESMDEIKAELASLKGE